MREIDGENVTLFQKGFNPRTPLDATLRTALISPGSLGRPDLDIVRDGLRLDNGDAKRCQLALSAVAAIFYSSPDRIDTTLVDALFNLATAESIPDRISGRLMRLLGFVARSQAAPHAWTRLSGILRDARCDIRNRGWLLRLVGEFTDWREDLVDLDGLLAVAESLPSPEMRAFLLDHGVERFVFSAPEAFTLARLEHIATLFEHAPRYRYVLRFLAARRSLAEDVRTFLAQQLAARFPLHEQAAAILTKRPVRILVVMNIRLGQGDEIVRLAPLLQALLDTNPLLTITLVARRTYLYDSPRVKTVPIGDAATVEAAFAESYDGIIEIFQPDRPELTYRFKLHDRLERLVAKCRPQLVIQAELGRAEKGDFGIRSEFLYQRVRVGDREVAGAFGLDRVARRNIYEPCLRLLAELGLPQRVAEELPLTASLLTGVRSLEAERVWRELVPQHRSGSARPVALVNPFGGADPVKGFHEQDALLAAEISGLVTEGYQVVVLPNGMSWGRRAAVLGAVSHLDRDTTAWVQVAPDPAESDPALQLDLGERADLDYADRVMRLFKYFATFADLVVTVEGWLSHLAFNLGRPFRLFLAAGSFTSDWFPYGRGPTQRLVTAFSPHSAAANGDAALPRAGDPPPLPHHGRKYLLEMALAELASPVDGETLAGLRGALTSPDCDVRAWVIAALGRAAPGEAKGNLLSSLKDQAPNVVREAANALLNGNVDCSRELGARYREQLQVHADIVRHDWDAVARLGPAAFPALFGASSGSNYVLVREAKALLRQMLTPYVRELSAVGPHAARDGQAVRAALAGILRAALTEPTTLDSSCREHLRAALRLDPDDPQLCELGLGALAALLFSRPDLASPATVEWIADLVAIRSLPAEIDKSAMRLLEFLAAGEHAPRAWVRLTQLLQDERIEGARRERLLPLVSEFVQWCPDIVGLDGILALAQSPALAAYPTFLFDNGVERFVFCTPEAFTAERLQRIAEVFGTVQRYPYVLYSLASRPMLAPEARAFVARELAGRFPHQETAGAILTGRPVALFVVLNTGMGQGDDVVRLVPLLQGLLDANPALSITLVTWRPYLYDNPRVTTIPIADDAAIATALTGPLDGIIEFFQPGAPSFTFRFEAHTAVESYLSTHQPALLIKGDMGRAYEGQAGNRFSFLHQTVELRGQDIAESRGLDQSPMRNVYEPAMRLLAELGLPQRAAEDVPLTPSILTGTPSADADRAWADIVADESGAEKRPVALVNPFGGSGTTKGFFEQDTLIAAEIAGLVAEGYLVVALPNGQKWGRRSNVLGILAHLTPETRTHVRIGPDPAETDEAAQLVLPERSTLAYGDRVMRAFKYFATYADLIVTVEGWLAHLAYNLGRPFRLFLAAGSYSAEYHPRNRGIGQQLVAALSPRARAPYAESALLREGDPPAVPHRPRKVLLEVALPNLGQCGGADAVGPLRQALASPAADIRTWAAVGLGRVIPAEAAKADLLAALEDRSPQVVREAADALLRESLDCSRELGARYRDVLQAHAEIVRHNWDAVARIGSVALPALFKAAESEVHDVSEGAKILIRKMLSPFVPVLRVPEAPAALSVGE